jgi:hypothetical protein
VGVAIPIAGLPRLSAQVQAWHASLERHGAHPVSVAGHAAGKRKPRTTQTPGKGIAGAILRVVAKRTVHVHDIYGAMPTAPISSIKACLTHMVEQGLLIRPCKAHYRAAP